MLNPSHKPSDLDIGRRSSPLVSSIDISNEISKHLKSSLSLTVSGQFHHGLFIFLFPSSFHGSRSSLGCTISSSIRASCRPIYPILLILYYLLVLTTPYFPVRFLSYLSYTQSLLSAQAYTCNLHTMNEMQSNRSNYQKVAWTGGVGITRHNTGKHFVRASQAISNFRNIRNGRNDLRISKKTGPRNVNKSS